MLKRALVAVAFLTGLPPGSAALAAVPPDEVAGSASRTAAPARLTIAFIAKSYANPVFLAAHRGAQDAARRWTESGVPVQVTVLTPTGESPAEQARRIRDAVRDDVDAIAIAASSGGLVAEAIDEAVGKGVAVLTFDVDLPESKRFAYFGADNEKAGESLLEELAGTLGGKGKVAILAGNPRAPNLQERVAGVEAAAKRHAGLEIVGVFHHLERPLDAAAEVLRVNRLHPEIDGWVMVGGWPLFESAHRKDVLRDLRARGQKVVAVDALPDQLRFVDVGIAVLFGQPVYEWGTVSVRTIVERLGQGKDVSGHIDMPLVRVSTDNLEDWAQQLHDWGFRDVSEEYLPTQ